jgi:hypothetical protein
MTPEEVVDLFRLGVEDTDTNDPLWSTLEVYNYLDEAQKEFARKTDYFSDASTASVCTSAVTADDPWVALSPLITKIRAAHLVNTGGKLTPVTFAQMEGMPNTSNAYNPSNSFFNGAYNPSNSFSNGAYSWMTSTGVPQYIVTDMEKDKGRLAATPTTDDTVSLQVYRLPLEDIVVGSLSLEITETDYQRKLIPYMKFMAYSKNDVDTMELTLADRSLAEARIIFSDVRAQMYRQRYSAHTGTVRYGGL